MLRTTADTLDTPISLEQWEDQLKKGAHSALGTLKDWGAPVPGDPIVVGLWFQSAGAHRDIPLPESLKATLKPALSPGAEGLVFEDISLPRELTRAVEF